MLWYNLHVYCVGGDVKTCSVDNQPYNIAIF